MAGFCYHSEAEWVRQRPYAGTALCSDYLDFWGTSLLTLGLKDPTSPVLCHAYTVSCMPPASDGFHLPWVRGEAVQAQTEEMTSLCSRGL